MYGQKTPPPLPFWRPADSRGTGDLGRARHGAGKQLDEDWPGISVFGEGGDPCIRVDIALSSFNTQL